jgi:hypothetical protein
VITAFLDSCASLEEFGVQPFSRKIRRYATAVDRSPGSVERPKSQTCDYVDRWDAAFPVSAARAIGRFPPSKAKTEDVASYVDGKALGIDAGGTRAP